MNREIYQLDENGFISEIYLGSFDEDGKLIDPIFNDEDIIICLTTLPQPLLFNKPKWNGSEWVEGESEEEKTEREAQQLLESLKPSPSEIANAELEIKVITMLTELEVVQ